MNCVCAGTTEVDSTGNKLMCFNMYSASFPTSKKHITVVNQTDILNSGPPIGSHVMLLQQELAGTWKTQ